MMVVNNNGNTHTARDLGATVVFEPSPGVCFARQSGTEIERGEIMVFHDGFDGPGENRASTAAAVKIVATRQLVDGYQFAAEDRILGLPARQATQQSPSR